MNDSAEDTSTAAAGVIQKEKDDKGVVLAAVIVAGHAIKHVYISGFQTIIFPEIKIGLGLSNTMLGALATARQASSGATTLGAGYLGDRFGRHAGHLLALSLAVMGVSFFLVGSLASYWLIFGAMFLVGLGPSLYHPPALGTLSRRFPQRRGFMISLHGTGGSAGEAFGPLVAAVAVGVIAWRATLQWSVVPALATSAIVWLIMRSIPMVEGGAASLRTYFRSLGGLFKNRALIALLVVSGVRNLGQSAVVLFLPIYLREDLAYSRERVAIYIFLAQVAGIAFQPVMGALSDRVGRKAVLVPSLFVFAFLLAALKYVEPGFWLVVVVIGMGLFLYALQALFLATASDQGGGEVQATIASLTYAVTFLAGTLSPVIAGLIADAHDVSATFLYSAALLLVSAVGVVIVRLPKRGDKMPKIQH